MIVDTHTHFYDPTRPQGVPWPAADNELLYRTVLPVHHRELAAPEGITGTVVVEASAWLDDNQWILDLADDDPWILGLVGHIDPGPGFGAGLVRFADHPLFLGIRLGGGHFDDIHSGSLLADVEALAARDLTLDVLVRDAQLEGVAEVARRIPDLRIVVNHVAHVALTGGEPDAAWRLRMAAIAEASPNVYCKVSGMVELAVEQPAPHDPDFYRPTLDALWDLYGEDRLVFGSNWPVSDRAAPYAAVVAVVRAYFEAQGSRAAAKYWHENARRAYRLKDGA